MNSNDLYDYLYRCLNGMNVEFNVLPADYLKREIFSSLKNKYFVVNNQNSNHPGEHWLAVCVIDDNYEFFDSYALGYEFYGNEFLNVFKQMKTVVQSNKVLQNEYSDVCGQYCLFYIAKKVLGCSLAHIYKYFSANTICNDEIVRKFVCKQNNHLFHKTCRLKTEILLQGCVYKNKIVKNC